MSEQDDLNNASNEVSNILKHMKHVRENVSSMRTQMANSYDLEK